MYLFILASIVATYAIFAFPMGFRFLYRSVWFLVNLTSFIYSGLTKLGVIMLSLAVFYLTYGSIFSYFVSLVRAPAPVVVPEATLYDFAVLFTILVSFVSFSFCVSRYLQVRINRTKLIKDVKTEYRFERMVDGSSFMTTKPPAFQAQVQLLVDGNWVTSGVGFKTVHGFITAYHVVADAEKIRLVGSDTQEFEPSDFEHIQVLGDVALLRRNICWLKQAKLSAVSLVDNTSEMVMINNGNISSIGPLKPTEMFGMVHYAGSTTSGFSGAPYFLGNMVFGMHLGAGAVNLGYESCYLEAIFRNENSEDYFLSKIKAGSFHKMRVSPFDPDEIMVKIGGRVVLLDRVEYQRAVREREEEEYVGKNAGNYNAFSENLWHLAGVDDDLPRKKKYRYRGPLGMESSRPDRVDFNDSENFDRPVVLVPSSAGHLESETESIVSENLQTTKEISSRSQRSGSLQAMEILESTHVRNVPASEPTYEDLLRNRRELNRRVSNQRKKIQHLTSQVQKFSRPPLTKQSEPSPSGSAQ